MHRSLNCLLGGTLLVAAALNVAAATLQAQVAQAPAPAQTVTPTNPAASIGEVETAVRAWAAAWSARDVSRYLAAYAPDFNPPRGQDRAAWEADRRARISGKSAISVGIDNLVISIHGQAASATFEQTYSADKLREKSRKTLELQRVGSRWLIRKESAGG